MIRLCMNSDEPINLIRFLSHFSANPFNIFNKYTKKRSILHIAASEDEIGVVRSLITIEPKLISLLDGDGYPPLFLSILHKNYHSTRILLHNGADPSIGGGMLGSCLHLTIVQREINLLSEIIGRGVDINGRDEGGNTGLHLLFATFTNNVEKSKLIAKLILENGGDSTIENKEGWTPLHLAIKNEQNDCIEWILKHNKMHMNERIKSIDLNRPSGIILFYKISE